MTMNAHAEPALYRDNPPRNANRARGAAAEATLEFGRFRVLLRRRQLVADGMPIELGTRALSISFSPCLKPTDRWLPKTSFCAVYGQASPSRWRT
jgi:hypothetical protein